MGMSKPQPNPTWLDMAACHALGIDEDKLARIRRRLAAEPSITGKPYAGEFA